jgi:DNA-3-methyladenine glycosylase
MNDNFAFLSSTDIEMSARQLLGCLMVRQYNDTVLVGRIVETEAYDQEDTASHSYRGITPRTKIMFGPAGYLYVYFTYGMHYCANVVCGPEGFGSAVLIRAVEPLEGMIRMRQYRNKSDFKNLTNGPAKFCQAFGISKELNGHSLRSYPLKLEILPPVDIAQITTTTRIGISTAQDKLSRFYITNNEFVSHPL